MLCEPYSIENCQKDVERFSYPSLDAYINTFNCSSVSKLLEHYIAHIMGGKVDEMQSVFDVHDCSKSWAKKVESRGISNLLNLSMSTHTGKGRFFTEEGFWEKVNGNDAYVVTNFNDLMKARTTPRMYLIPTSIVADIYKLGIIENGLISNNVSGKKRGQLCGVKRFNKIKLKDDWLTFVKTCEPKCLKPQMEDLFPYDVFKLDLTLEKPTYPSVDELIANCREKIILKNTR
jgi:hypothetical protein